MGGRLSSGRPKSTSGRRMRTHQTEADEIEDDVPASLLIEDHDMFPKQLPPRPSSFPSPPSGPSRRSGLDSPSPVGRRSRNTTLPLHHVPPRPAGYTMTNVPPKEKALWHWANVENLDIFLADVYDYYIFDGYWSIILSRILNLATVVFIVGFCLFLTQCIDYSKIRGSNKLEEIYVHRCTARMGFFPNLILWLTTFVCFTRSFGYVKALNTSVGCPF